MVVLVAFETLLDRVPFLKGEVVGGDEDVVDVDAGFDDLFCFKWRGAVEFDDVVFRDEADIVQSNVVVFFDVI